MMKSEKNIEYQIAEKVVAKGGRVFYVGGCLRDQLLNIENKDIDIEVYGISVQQLKEILKDFGQVNAYGSSFGILSIANYNLDISMPRKEKNYGKGHGDFEIFVDPFMSTYDACLRRDFTMNSIMQDVISKQIIDHFKGIEDINKKIIRHTNDDTFSEDPLRVLRAAGFASRLDFKIADKTIDLCKNIDLSSLSRERVEEETRKALLKGIKPSLYFEYLRKMNQLDYWYPYLMTEDFQKVWNNTMNDLDKAASYHQLSINPEAFMLLVLFNRLYQNLKNINSIIQAIQKITNNNKIINYILNMLPLSANIKDFYLNKTSNAVLYHLFYEAKAVEDILLLSKCQNDINTDYLVKQYKDYQKIINEDYVTGKDLIKMGIKSGKNYSKILSYATDLRLKGINKEKALSLCLEYAENLDN